jgi:protein ImuB
MHTPAPLWICLGLPALPLEALGLGQESKACVLSTGGQDPRVLIGSRAAYLLGITKGMRLGAAYALGQIEVHAHCGSAEQAALEALAAWCGQFTSCVSLAPPEGLLLEIGRSLALFHGLEELVHAIRSGVSDLGYQAILAIAPTPLAAIFFVRAHQAICLTDPRHLRGALGRLPLMVLGLEDGVAEALAGLGLRDLGDCLCLPRDGLARRFGPELLSLLDRAVGRQPDTRVPFEPPARFKRVLDLPHEVDDTEALQFATRRLLLELTGFLRARGAGVRQLLWRLVHRERRESTFRLELVEPSRDPEHLGQLLHIRLERLSLPEPVRALKLVVDELCPLAGVTLALLPGAKERAQPFAFLERLRARLGGEAVRGLRLVPDHRPEAAWRFCPPDEAGVSASRRRRPLWLLAEPRALVVREGRPQLRGALELLNPRERIEAGWWDGRPIARDYFVARNPEGGCYWVFREEHGRWFVHGIFG